MFDEKPTPHDFGYYTIWQFSNGVVHREDGPAIDASYSSGNTWKEWRIHGLLHREDGPAVDRTEGNGEVVRQNWFSCGQHHRMGGPAVFHSDGTKEWWADGRVVTEDWPKGFFFEKNSTGFLRSKVAKFEDGCVHFEDGSVCCVDEGRLNRIYGPALIDKDGTKFWFRNGKRHRVDGPAVEAENYAAWYRNGLLHREDGPAVENQDSDWRGYKIWFSNGKMHRVGGPAEISGKMEAWYIDGQLHREDGPAWINHGNSNKEWWIHGQQLTEEQFNNRPVRHQTLNGYVWRLPNGDLHREDGPAVEDNQTGVLEWRIRGKLHRVDGPAWRSKSGREFWYYEGELHRTDGPACRYPDGREGWFLHGKRHRSDGPALIAGNAQRWYVDGLLHREDGPAVVDKNGEKRWYIRGERVTEAEYLAKMPQPSYNNLMECMEWRLQNGMLHREGAPAVEYNSGSKGWWRNGVRHRENGPALELVDGRKEWWINGQRHRLEGPALTLTFEDGSTYQEWHIHGKMMVTEDGHRQILSMGKTLEPATLSTMKMLHQATNVVATKLAAISMIEVGCQLFRSACIHAGASIKITDHPTISCLLQILGASALHIWGPTPIKDVALEAVLTKQGLQALDLIKDLLSDPSFMESILKDPEAEPSPDPEISFCQEV